MKIGITLHPYGEKRPAGLGRAIFELIKAMLEIDQENEYAILSKDPNLDPDLPGSNWRVQNINNSRILKSLDVCIFNTPILPLRTYIWKNIKKTVVIAYDFAYLQYSPNPFLKLAHSFALKHADLIISISEATKKDLINIFKIPEEKIKVVYLGYNKICEVTPKPTSNLPEKFFLFVGAIKERKNVHGVVEAFKNYSDSGGQNNLVIAGNGSGEYFEKIKSMANGNKVIFLNQISDGQLSYLYQNAEVLLYPSFVEGFGLPILEAQSCGLPVITSNVSSLPEVAGDGAILVDPKNTLEIAEAMKKISLDSTFRQDLIEKGFLNAKKFSWQKTAQEILKLL